MHSGINQPDDDFSHELPGGKRRSLQWSLQTLLLLTALIAMWVTYLHYRRQIPRLQQQVDTMQRMARELIVLDEHQISVVKRQEHWYDENRWDLYLPPGPFMLRLATREIDEQGLPAPLQTRSLAGGVHRLELLQTKTENGWTIKVMVDEEPPLEAAEVAQWQLQGSSTGDSQIGDLTQQSADKPLVLFRRRFYDRDENGTSVRPTGPCNGLLLWIDKVPD